MDITITKSELTKALFVTESIVEKRNTMPILSNLLLAAADGKLEISATDLEITALTSVNATVKSPGSITVNAKIFADIVRELPDSDITIKLGERDRIEICANNARLKMIGASSEGFPSIAVLNFEARGVINSRELLDIINKTIYAVSIDETRFILNGVCFEMVSQEKNISSVRLVATDGHRIALATRNIKGFSFKDRVVVPRKGLAEIRKLVSFDENRPVGIDIRDGNLLLDTGESKICVRLLDGEFPDYNQVLPKEAGVIARVNSAVIAQVLRRVALMVSDKGKCVRLDFDVDTLRISSSSPEIGEATEEISLEYSSKPFSVGFNAKYILDIITSFGEAQTVVMELNGDQGPCKLTVEGDDSSIAVIMPMRLN